VTSAQIRHVVSVEPDGEEFRCREDQHLLEAMRAVGKNCIPSGCHGGGCGVCKSRVLRGDVERLVMSRKHVSEQEESEGIVLACRTLPRSSVSLVVFDKSNSDLRS